MIKILFFACFFLFLALPLTSGIALAAPSPSGPVTQEKFNRLVALMKKMYERMEELEMDLANARLQNSSQAYPSASSAELQQLRQRIAQLESQLRNKPAAMAPATSAQGGEGAVDLDDLDSAPSPTNMAKGDASKNLPILKAYFDLNLYSLPGGQAKGSGLTFDNFHSFILLDFVPSEDILFFTDVSPTPTFYEINYRLATDLYLRMGKISIPFDDMDPHNIFGGRTNVSRITVGNSFLPDYFSDLGVGLRWKIFNSADFVLDTSGYVVNGFRSGGTDPVSPGGLYPSFSSSGSGADNNKDKAMGGRAHALFWGTLGIGASYYAGRWTDEDVENRRLSMLGVDAQLYLTSTTTLRAGVATKNVKLPSTSPDTNYYRNGAYAEIGQKFGSRDQWNFLIRGGTLNLDNRVENRDDKQIVGAKLLWKPDLLEWSIEHSEDTKTTADKTTRKFTNFRVIASF
jgi:hypothetical protein